MRFCFSSMLILLMIAASVGVAQDRWNVTPVGQLTLGQPHSVIVDDPYAYVLADVTNDFLLSVIDFSDPLQPRSVATFHDPAFNQRATAMVQEGHLLYIAAQSAGLRIVDVSDPLNPVEVGAFNPEARIFDVAVAGQYAYVVEQQNVAILDVSNPANPQVLDYLSLAEPVGRVSAQNERLFVLAADGDGGFLYLFDLTTPEMPVEIGVFSQLETPRSLFVRDSFVFIADAALGVSIVDFSNPELLLEVGFYHLPGATELVVGETAAYVSTQTDGIHLLDISDFQNINPVGLLNTPEPRGLDVTNDLLVFTDYQDGVFWYSQPVPPQEVAQYTPPIYTWDVLTRDQIAYVSDYFGGLLIYDLADPTHPRLAGQFEAEGFSWGVTVEGQVAYLTLDSPDYSGSALYLIDVSDPAAPVEIGSVALPDQAKDVHVSGDYAYVAAYAAGVRVIDISDPANPQEVGSYPLPPDHRAFGLDVAGDRLYLAVIQPDFLTGYLQIIDVSDPTLPQEISSTATPGVARDVQVQGNLAYVCAMEGGLRIYDVQQDQEPVELGHHLVEDYVWQVDVVGDFAYAACNWDGLVVFDVSDPFHIEEAGFFNTPGQLVGVSVSGDYVTVGNYGTGLRVLQFEDEMVALNPAPANIGTPARFRLLPSYPNPFNPHTSICYDLTTSASVYLNIYDATGRLVWRSFRYHQSAGRYSLIWRGIDSQGMPVKSGFYLLQLQVDDQVDQQPLILLR